MGGSRFACVADRSASGMRYAQARGPRRLTVRNRKHLAFAPCRAQRGSHEVNVVLYKAALEIFICTSARRSSLHQKTKHCVPAN